MSIKFFSPARVVRGYRWYITFTQTHPISGKRVIKKETFALNRIKDLVKREQMAQHWRVEVDKKLPLGYPFEELMGAATGESLTLEEALQVALKEKMKSPREQTHSMYKSITTLMMLWAKASKLDQHPVQLLTSGVCQRWLDWLKDVRKVSNRTHNNYLAAAKSFWRELERREHVDSNPWTKLKTLRQEAKKRRTLRPEEAKTMAVYMAKHDPDLLAMVLHVYYAAIRPTELRRLRVRDVDYVRGVVCIPADASKSWKERHTTLPKDILPYLQKRTEYAHPDQYLFGSGLRVGDSPSSTNVPPQRHLKARLACLPESKGVSLYSWKDTGLTRIANELKLFDAQMQAGHSDPRMTMVYIERPTQINGVSDMRDDLLEKVIVDQKNPTAPPSSSP